MEIAEDTVVQFDYTLTDSEGEVVDTSDGREPLAYLHGHGHIVPGLEKALEGNEAGAELQVTVPPEEGYGPYRDELVQTVSKEIFAGVDKVEPGMQFQAESAQGPLIVTVKSIEGEQVVIDGNHMLAGQDLNFDIKVREVRPATEEERSEGQVQQTA